MNKILTLSLVIFALTACSSERKPSTVDIDAARAAGVAAAQYAATLEQGSMEQENAVLRIRARESELRRQGFEAEADTFAAAAERVLATIF